MDSKETLLMNVSEYFLTRKKYIDRYVEGEHKWYGDVTEGVNISYVNEPRPWYLEHDSVSKTP